MTTPETTPFAENHPVATDLGKNFAGAIVTTAGMLVGSYLFGTIKGKIDARKAQTVNPETDTEE